MEFICHEEYQKMSDDFQEKMQLKILALPKEKLEEIYDLNSLQEILVAIEKVIKEFPEAKEWYSFLKDNIVEQVYDRKQFFELLDSYEKIVNASEDEQEIVKASVGFINSLVDEDLSFDDAFKKLLLIKAILKDENLNLDKVTTYFRGDEFLNCSFQATARDNSFKAEYLLDFKEDSIQTNVDKNNMKFVFNDNISDKMKQYKIEDNNAFSL